MWNFDCFQADIAMQCMKFKWIKNERKTFLKLSLKRTHSLLWLWKDYLIYEPR